MSSTLVFTAMVIESLMNLNSGNASLSGIRDGKYINDVVDILLFQCLLS